MKRRQPSLAVVVPWTILVVLTALGGAVLWLTRSDEAATAGTGELVSFDVPGGREPLPERGRLCFAGLLTSEEPLESHAVVDLADSQADIAVLYGRDDAELLLAQGELLPVLTAEHVFDVITEIADTSGTGTTVPIRFTLASNRLSLPGEAVLAAADCTEVSDEVALLDAARQD